MVQVRCPECGYLQTLSEERFLAISEDFLNCPHCHARVPKQWEASAGDVVPEEARHKILAFSRRILNSGDVGREVVSALEALVRHYGSMEETKKALGVGYARIGEYRKAEEFLLQAFEESPEDLEIVRGLLDILLNLEKFAEAVHVGRALVGRLGSSAGEEEVAKLALGLLGLEKKAEAQALLAAYPHLDARHPAMRTARKQLGRGSRRGLATIFGEDGPLHRLLRSSIKYGRKSPGNAATKTGRESAAGGEGAAQPRHDPGDTAQGEGQARRTAPITWEKPLSTIEYWVYAPDTTIPQWDHVRERFSELNHETPEKDHAFKFLESASEKNQLTIDYIHRDEATELFDYPQEIMLRNSMGFEDSDAQALAAAKMIVRVRFSAEDFPGTGGLSLLMRLVETIRSLTGGVVQDAVSHMLWGARAWKEHIDNPEKSFLESQVRFDVLDEGGAVWIHTHGMLKFGLPDLEAEGIPAEFVSSTGKLMMTVAETLLTAPGQDVLSASVLSVPGTPVLLKMELRPRDEEGHFPGGSLRIVPHVSGRDYRNPESLREALILLEAESLSVEERSGARPTALPPDKERRQDRTNADLRELLLTAHRRARADLSLFKQSFQQTRPREGTVHAVKVGFPAHRGEYEWMWVSLDAWRGQSLVGYVENSPVLRKDLKKGSRVQFCEGEIFDWVISREGNVVKGAFTEEHTV